MAQVRRRPGRQGERHTQVAAGGQAKGGRSPRIRRQPPTRVALQGRRTAGAGKRRLLCRAQHRHHLGQEVAGVAHACMKRLWVGEGIPVNLGHAGAARQSRRCTHRWHLLPPQAPPLCTQPHSRWHFLPVVPASRHIQPPASQTATQHPSIYPSTTPPTDEWQAAVPKVHSHDAQRAVRLAELHLVTRQHALQAAGGCAGRREARSAHTPQCMGTACRDAWQCRHSHVPAQLCSTEHASPLAHAGHAFSHLVNCPVRHPMLHPMRPSFIPPASSPAHSVPCRLSTPPTHPPIPDADHRPAEDGGGREAPPHGAPGPLLAPLAVHARVEGGFVELLPPLTRLLLCMNG